MVLPAALRVGGGPATGTGIGGYGGRHRAIVRDGIGDWEAGGGFLRVYAVVPVVRSAVLLELIPTELPWLLCIAFVAGLVDAAVGGGGLSLIPGVLSAAPPLGASVIAGH
ncbi:hypothetical protein P0965_22510, partial [Xanthomonas hortorum pv. gardneri]